MAAALGFFRVHTRPPGIVELEDDCIDQMSLVKEGSLPPVTIVDIVSNSVILRQIAPYVPPAALFALATTNKTIHSIMYQSPDTFRYLNLSNVRSATFDSAPIDKGAISWRSQRMDESLTEDEFYSGPLRGIMSKLARRNILRHVTTMILDGLTVPADIIREIISEDRFNVRILSVREAKHLNERKLMQVLKYAVRPSRPAGTPKLRGLYVFGAMDPRPTPLEPVNGRRRSPTRYPDSSHQSVMTALGAQLGAEWNQKSQEALNTELCGTMDKWYQPGRMFKKTLISDWAETIQACEGIIHFDAVLCRGPRHDPKNFIGHDPSTTSHHNGYIPPTVATVALGTAGCAGCGTCPEGPGVFGQSPSHHLPLLAPPPLHASSIRAAQIPYTKDGSIPRLYVRCTECLKNRWCERCNKWWDESCYKPGDTRTEFQATGWLLQWQPHGGDQPKEEIKVHMGLCVESCLVGELMGGAGEGGMWG
ncbi:hypothetical protein FKW77_004081 [Venturia effusa]|uniref:F-box domain-containing protein n=1 Tax=Venturia effusa TaxID=50376 RepID=A0A517LII3_9PEZI|nr:hypothetical protein FKW77_004081 [Venturia effusa]